MVNVVHLTRIEEDINRLQCGVVMHAPRSRDLLVETNVGFEVE